MKYIKGFKYQLAESESFQTNILGYNIDDDYYSLTPDGVLIAKKGFAWDGCSGSFDTRTNMRGGLGHDILCLMVARGQLPVSAMPKVNDFFYGVLIEDEMVKIRADWHHTAVDWHFAGNRKPERRQVIVLNKPDRRADT